MSINVHRLLPLVQATIRSTGPGSRCERLLSARRVNIGCLAVALAFNAATPFITSERPVVIAIRCCSLSSACCTVFRANP